MLTIRLSRGGANKRPFYHMVVTDSRNARDGRFIEKLGFFNPIATGGEERLRYDSEPLNHWVSTGATLSPRVATLVKEFNMGSEAVANKKAAKKAKTDAKKAAAQAAKAQAESAEEAE